MKNNVSLVACTQPKVSGVNTAEEFVAFVARVSNPSNQMNNETSPKLLKYLKDNKHWSPFEHVYMTFEIETTRDIARQILRHRSFTFQEFSQRYADASDLGFTNREMRMQDKKNRQNSIVPDMTDNLNIQSTNLQWNKIQEELIQKITHYYKWALDCGIAKEQARAILPEGLTMSRMYMTGNLRNFIHYCEVRTDPSTQKEHREVAEKIYDLIKKEFGSAV
jgi:thymidylate synthase (FAD)